MAECGGQHVVCKVSFIWGEDAPEPEWPERRSDHVCICGARIDYRHVIHRLVWEDGQMPRPVTSGA